MASPGFNNPVFQHSGPAAVQHGGHAAQTYPGRAGYAVPTVPPEAETSIEARLEGAYASPSAGAHETGRMTVEDTIIKTAGLFVVVLVFAVVSFFWTREGAIRLEDVQSLTMIPTMIGVVGGLVLGLVNAFRKVPSVPLIVAYAAFQGLLVGGFSSLLEARFSGIIGQAVLGTFAVVGVTLALFSSGKIRASAKMTKIFMIAMVGYLVFSLLNLGLTAFGVLDGWGMREGMFGIVIGILVVIMAAYALVLDFDLIQNGVRNGAPRVFAWQAAFGLMATIVWLYIEILRMIAIARSQ